MVARSIFCLCFTALITLASTGGSADEPKELGSDIRIEAATATPGTVGGTSELRFRLVNESTARLVLLGIATPVAEHANLVAGLGASRSTVLGSISIPAEDVLDLTTSHLRYEIFPLKRTLVSGEEFPLTLNFVGFTIEVSAAAPIGLLAHAEEAHHQPESAQATTPSARAQSGQGMMGPGMMGPGMMMSQGNMMGGQGMMSGHGMQGMMGQGGMMSGPGMSMMTQHVEGRIAFLRTELKITDKQAKEWNEFANALRENAKRIGAAASMKAQGPQTPQNLAQALEQEERLLKERVAGLATIRITYDHLQSVLSDDQKKLAEQLLPPHLGLMPGMMM